ncbi:MAG TPA: PilW family protein [Aquabacterium sp.]|nr:PilW family protein [Aquabacterium sp.]
MSRYPRLSSSRRAEQGFTLIELMVGVLLGMITVIVIGQVLVQSESQRRNVSTGGDANVNGSLALYSIQRDVQMAGYGISNPAALGCTVKYKHGTDAASSFTLAPVIITRGVGGASDSIKILQGNTPSTAVPMSITSDQTGRFQVTTTMGVRAGDQVVAVPQAWSPSDTTNWCLLYEVTNSAASADTTLSNDNLPHASTSDWNGAGLAPSGGYPSGSYLLNLGAPSVKTYSVSSSYNLQLTERSASDGSTSTPQDLYPQIVNMQALYGWDNNGDGTVDEFKHASPTTTADWQKVVSIRLAIVARSSQFEREAVTTSEPQWDVGAEASFPDYTTTSCGTASKCITLTISNVGTGTDWQHYRYKVYTTTVPLRNILWNS